jgi:hypothetical protein
MEELKIKIEQLSVDLDDPTREKVMDIWVQSYFYFAKEDTVDEEDALCLLIQAIDSVLCKIRKS